VVYARAGRPADARPAMREALELFREADSPMGIAQVLQALTFMASWEGRHTDAVPLAGAAEALRERLGGRAPGLPGQLRRRPRGLLPRPPPQGVADRAFAEGRALSVDDAMALAIGVT
jgi:hypothetical protein